MNVPFVGGSYPLKRKKADTQQTVNMIVCNVESGSGKARKFLKSVAGLTRFSALENSLTLVKTQEVSSATVGDSQTYTVVVTNGGPDKADGAKITEALPLSLTFTSCAVAYTGGAAGPASATALELAAGIVIPTWPVGGVVTLTIIGTFSASGSAVNTATATVAVGSVGATVTDSVTATVTGPPWGLFYAPLIHGDGDDTIVPIATLSTGGTITYVGTGAEFDSSAGLVSNVYSNAKLQAFPQYDGQRFTLSLHAEAVTSVGGGTGNTQRFLLYSTGLDEASFAFRVVSGSVHLYSYFEHSGGGGSTQDHGAFSSGDVRIELDMTGSGVVNWYLGGALVRTEANVPADANFRLQLEAPVNVSGVLTGVSLARFSEFRGYLGDPP